MQIENKLGKFDDRPVDEILKEEKPVIKFEEPKLEDIVAIFKKIDKKCIEKADNEILGLVNIFGKFYVEMNSQAKEYGTKILNNRLKKFLDEWNSRFKILIKEYGKDLEKVYETYLTNVQKGARERKINEQEIYDYLRSYTP